MAGTTVITRGDTVASESELFCTRCGEKTEIGADYCTGCGKRLEKGIEEETRYGVTVEWGAPSAGAPSAPQPEPMRTRGGAMKKLTTLTKYAVAAFILIGVIYAGYYYLSPLLGGGGGGGGAPTASSASATITPSTARVGDIQTLTIAVTNKGGGTMTITNITATTYRNGQYAGSGSIPIDYTTIPQGQTNTISSQSLPVPNTYYGQSTVGTWKEEFSIATNYGTLTCSCSYTILA